MLPVIVAAVSSEFRGAACDRSIRPATERSGLSRTASDSAFIGRDGCSKVGAVAETALAMPIVEEANPAGSVGSGGIASEESVPVACAKVCVRCADVGSELASGGGIGSLSRPEFKFPEKLAAACRVGSAAAFVLGAATTKCATPLPVESGISSGRLTGFFAGRTVPVPATDRRAIRFGNSPAALPLSFAPSCKLRGKPPDIAGLVRASMPAIANDISDVDRTDAKLGASIGASCEFGVVFVVILESAGTGAAESELEMDSATIGLTFAAQSYCICVAKVAREWISDQGRLKVLRMSQIMSALKFLRLLPRRKQRQLGNLCRVLGKL